MTQINRQWVLARRPEARVEEDCFALREAPVPEPSEGQVLLRTRWLSFESELPPGPRNYINLMVQRSKMQGFVLFDYLPRFPEALEALESWVAEGKLVWEVDVQRGFENVPRTLIRLYTGANFGKQLLEL